MTGHMQHLLPGSKQHEYGNMQLNITVCLHDEIIAIKCQPTSCCLDRTGYTIFAFWERLVGHECEFEGISRPKASAGSKTVVWVLVNRTFAI